MGEAAYVLDLAAVGSGDVPAAGGKGASLGELTRAGLQVPPGFVVTTAAFALGLRAADPDGSFPRAVAALDPSDPGELERVTAPIRDRIMTTPLPDGLEEAVTAAYRALAAAAGGDDRGGGGDVPVAVRSSATAEDSAEASFAGLQHTGLWVRGPAAVAEEVRRCWVSLYSLESVAYRRRRGLPEETMAMAVVVQRMVDARCAGVLFTRSPATGDRSVVALEAGWGLGSAVVSGEVTPDQYTASKVTGELLRRTVATKLRWHRPDPVRGGVLAEDVPEHLRERPCLTGEEVAALVTLARRVEDHYGCPQDVEWAVAGEIPDGPDGPGSPDGRGGQGAHAGQGGPAAAGSGLFVLQSRPETVWSAREAAPVAAPRPRAFDHVIARLGLGPAATDRGGSVNGP